MVIIRFINFNILSVPFYLSLVGLVLVLLFQLFSREKLKKHASRFFLYSAAVAFAYLLYIGFLQFRDFQSGIMGPLLGKKSGFLWFLSYTRLHYWNKYLISLPAGILVALVAYYFNKKHAERFFEPEELYLAALGILLVGYPGFLFYIPLVLIASVVGSLLFVRRGERLPLYHFWLPTALVVLFIIQFWARNQEWWATFRF